MSCITRLQNIKDLIEIMNKCQQIEILKLLIKSSVSLSENSNGTFINLSDLDEKGLVTLENYIAFVNKQDNQLLNMEEEKEHIKKEFFKQEKRNIKLKKDKENTTIVLDV